MWLNIGLVPAAALALVRAGYRSLVDLEGRSRKELLAIPGLGRVSVERLAEALEEPMPGRYVRGARPRRWPDEVWRQRGVPSEAAITFDHLGMTIERLKTMTREDLLSLQRVGVRTVRACELILGRTIPSREESHGRG